jgi:SAM-dependent methyltransferase
MGAPADRYAGAAQGWAGPAARVYGPLARDLVAAVPVPLAGATVLDAGAGTGLVSAELLARRACPVALDLSPDMLRWRRAERPPAAVAEIGRIPLRTASVDATLAAFVLNHLPDPGPALRSFTRVTRPGGVVLAAVFANSAGSAARNRVDEVAVAHGFRWPDWYRELKEISAPRLGTADRMREAASEAGLTAVSAQEYAVDVGLDRAADLVDYRYSQAHCCQWVAGLAPPERERLRAAAIVAAEPIMEPYRPRVVRLVATAP